MPDLPQPSDRLIAVGDVFIDFGKIVGIEPGTWNERAQDWFAIAVMEGNTRIGTVATMRTLQGMIHRWNRGEPPL